MPARDLAALTAHTGDEFLFLTLGGRRLIIRGNNEGFYGVVTEAWARKMASEGWRLSVHTHPLPRGMSDALSLIPSGGDIAILEIFKQNQSLIINSKGVHSIFGP